MTVHVIGRINPATGTPLIEHLGRCFAGNREEGKVMIATRRAARKAIRSMHEPGMREYRCRTCEMWHVGHLPLAVIRGRATVADVLAWASSRPIGA